MRRDQSVRASVPMFEGLESRLLLAGGVSAFVSAGSLYVIGDWFDNDVVVTGVTANEIQVASGADATTINGEAGPLTFSGITADVILAMGDGNDTLVATNVNVPRDLTVDLGPGGDNSFTLQTTTVDLAASAVGRNALILGSYGQDDILVDGVTFGGNLTIDGGSSADETTIDVNHSTIAGSLTVFLWTATGPNEVGAEDTNIGGDASIYNGVGWLHVVFSNVDIDGNLLIQNLGTVVVPKGLGTTGATTINMSVVTVDGNATINLFTGGSTIAIGMSIIQGTLAVNTGAGSDSISLIDVGVGESFTGVPLGRTSRIGNVATFTDSGGILNSVYLGAVLISGGTRITFASGVDNVWIEDSTLAGNLLIFNGPGSLELNIRDVDVLGNALLQNLGGGALVDGLGRPAVDATYIRIDPTTITGDLTILNGVGDDRVILEDVTVGGNTYINNGIDGSDVHILDSALSGWLTIVNAGGSSGTEDEPDYNAHVFIGGTNPANGLGQTAATTIGGSLIVLNGWGDDLVELEYEAVDKLGETGTPVAVAGDVIVVGGADSLEFFGEFEARNCLVVAGAGDDWIAPGPTLTGWFYADLGPGGATCGFDSADIAGNVTMIRGWGGTSPNRPGFAGFTGIHSGSVGGNFTVLCGGGNDETDFNDAEIGGSVFGSAGPDGAFFTVQDSLVGGSVTLLRGDGGAVALLGGVEGGSKAAFASATVGAPVGLGPDPTSGSVLVDDSTVTGDLTVITGSGDDVVAADGANIGGNVHVNTGLGRAQVDFESTPVGGNFTVWAFDNTAEVYLGGAALTTIGGDLFVQTGSGADDVQLDSMSIAGKTTLCTFSGADTVDIVASLFTGDVFIRTGPEGEAPGSNGGDVVNVERVVDSGTVTEFVGDLTLRTGAGDDAVNIGLAGDGNPAEGLGAVGSHAEVRGQFDLDGGLGDDTLDYLTADNVFDLTPIITHVETMT